MTREKIAKLYPAEPLPGATVTQVHLPAPLSDAVIREALINLMFAHWDAAVKHEETRRPKPWEKR